MPIYNPYRSTTIRPEFHEVLTGNLVPRSRDTDQRNLTLGRMYMDALRHSPPLYRSEEPDIGRDMLTYEPEGLYPLGVHVHFDYVPHSLEGDQVQAVSLSALGRRVMVRDDPYKNVAILLTGEATAEAERDNLSLATLDDLNAAKLRVAEATVGFYRSVLGMR